MQKATTVAAFDFDGTLTYRDTLLPFLIFTTGYPRSLLNLFCCLPCFIGFLFGLRSRQRVKEAVLTRFFRGWPIAKLQQLGEQFAEHLLDSKLKQKALARLRWHQAHGDRCILVSASLDIYLKPWADRMGFSEILTSRLQVNSEGAVTGRLEGNNCWGPEKAERLRTLLKMENGYELFAYGDSRGDRELLAMADHAFFRNMPTD